MRHLPAADGLRTLVHVQRRAHSVPRAVPVVEAHGPEGSARQGVQSTARGAFRPDGGVDANVALQRAARFEFSGTGHGICWFPSGGGCMVVPPD